MRDKATLASFWRCYHDKPQHETASSEPKERTMRRVVGVDHLSICVSDIERSKTFYKKVLGSLGFKLKYDLGDYAGWSNGKTLFWIKEADAEGKKYQPRIGDVGLHHYAFELSKR